MSEALAIDVVRDPGTELGSTLDRFAGAFSARFRRFGAATPRHSPSLLSRIEARWSPGALTAGLIEVYDGADFGALVREWTVTTGYEGDEYRSEIPFVIPVDTANPTADVGGVRAARRPDPKNALRPVAVRQAPTPSPRPREQWRPAAARTLSPYPAALGNAGAVQSHLLRFPEARAQLATTTRRALVEDTPGAAAHPWDAPGTPAREDGRLADAIEARLTGGAAVVPIAAWLVPHTLDGAQAAPLADRPRAIAGRWSSPSTGPALALGARFSEAAPGLGDTRSGAPRALALPEVETTLLAGDRSAIPSISRQISSALGGRSASEAMPRAGEAPAPTRERGLRGDAPLAADVAAGAPPSASTRTTTAGESALASSAGERALIMQRTAVAPADRFAERAAFVPRLLQAAAHESQPWSGRSEAAPPFVPGGLAAVALALGQAFDAPSRAPSGWSALADGRTLVLPSATREVPATRATRAAQATQAQATQATQAQPTRALTPPSTPPTRRSLEPSAAMGRAAEAVVGLVQPAAFTATTRIDSGFDGSSRASIRALTRGLDLLSAAPPGHQPGPVAAHLPALARPFAAAATLPETHREVAPSATAGAPSFGERLAAFAARAEVSLGLTVASSPAGSLDAPWFAQDTGTLLVPLPAPRSPAGAQSEATARGGAASREDARQSEATRRPTASPLEADRPPMGRLLSLPALAIAVQTTPRAAIAGPAAERGTLDAPSPEPPLRDGALLPLRAGPLDATYVVPTHAPLAAPALTTGAERAARFADAVAGPRATPPRPEPGTPHPSASGAVGAPLVGPLHPALAPFARPTAAATPPTLGERLAEAALVAFQVPARPAAGRALELESPRELVVPSEAPAQSPSRIAARAEVEAARIQARAEARAELARAQAARSETRAPRPEVARTEAQRVEAQRVEAQRVDAQRADARRVDAQRAEAQRADAQRADAQRADAQRVGAQRSARAPDSSMVSGTSPGDPLSAATELSLLRAPGRALDISAPSARAERFVRWLTGEVAGQPALTAQLQAAGILAPGARVQPAWLDALTDAGALVAPPATAARPAAPVEGAELIRPSAVEAAPSAQAAESRLGITAWPATVQRLLEVWRIAEATLDGPATPRSQSDSAAASAGWLETPETTWVVPFAPAAPSPQRALPGTTALAAAGLGTRLATRRFDELLAAAPSARPMISPPMAVAAPRSLEAAPARSRPSAVAHEGTRDVLVQAGMASVRDAESDVISSTSGYSMADLQATSAVWPALVAPAVGADAALGASEEWAGSAAPGGRLAAPLNFERALLTWSAAAVRDADSRATEQRTGQALGPLGQLVRQNAVVMGPRTVDVAMRAATGGSLFGDRGPAGLVAPDVHAKRVMVDPGVRAAEQALRSTPGERPTRDTETSEEAQHRLADQVGEDISPEETERLAREIISRLKRELEFDAARMGDDAWD